MDVEREKEIFKAELSRQLGALLAQARAELGLTQQQLAETTRLSVDVISKIERGAFSRLDLGTYGLLARALNVDLTWFESRTEAGGDAINLLRLMFSDAEGKNIVLRPIEERLIMEDRDLVTPLLVLVGGYAGSGKSEFGKATAQVTGWPVVDKDVTARPMAEQLLEALGQDRNDRHSTVYLEKVRPAEYRSTMEVALRNVECGHSTIVTAPFLREMVSADWTREFQSRCTDVGCEPVYVWIDCDIPTMHSHLLRRGAARDTWKLANWSTYEDSIDLAMRPCVPHTVVDNRGNAALSLAAQATSLANRVARRG